MSGKTQSHIITNIEIPEEVMAIYRKNPYQVVTMTPTPEGRDLGDYLIWTFIVLWALMSVLGAWSIYVFLGVAFK